MVLVLSSCSTPARYYGMEWPVFEKVEKVKVPEDVEGGSEVVEVEVNALKRALAVAEAYDQIVPYFNRTVDNANGVVAIGRRLAEDNDRLWRKNEVLTWCSAGVGFVAMGVAGFTAGVLAR